MFARELLMRLRGRIVTQTCFTTTEHHAIERHSLMYECRIKIDVHQFPTRGGVERVDYVLSLSRVCVSISPA